MASLALLFASGPTPAQDILSLFSFDQAWSGLQQFKNSLGTATSGPLGELVISLFLISLLWTWVKNKFDTWSFWDLFLRLFMVAAGILSWDSLFRMINSVMNWLANGAGLFNPYQCFYNLVYLPFNNLTVDGIAWGAFMQVDFYHPGLMILAGIEGFLTLLIVAIYAFSVVAQELTTMLLYAIGPLFLCCWLMDAITDLWQRWVRSFLTIKVWLLVMNFTLFIYSNAVSTNTLNGTFSQAQTWILPAAYLLLLIVSLGAAYPIARGLVGGHATPFFSGGGVTSAAGAAIGAAGMAAGMAIGAATGGPAGAGAGAGAGAAAGRAASGMFSAATQRE